MHSILLSPFVGLFAVASVLAQQPVAVKAFFPDGYDTVLCADLASMRERGILDDLDATALKLVLPRIEKEIGFPIACLDRATMVVEPRVAGGKSNGLRRLVLFEGNAPLSIPDRIAHGQYAAEHVAGRELHRNEISTWSVFAQPQPMLQVMGHEDFVVPVLEGKKGPGMPSPDVMSLLSGRPDSLAYSLLGLSDAEARAKLLADVFEGTTWPADDEPTHILMRLHAVGEADDPHIEFEVVLRHRKVGDGIVASEAAVDAFVARFRKEGPMVSLRPVLKNVQKRRDRGDLCASVDLGRTRDAVGHLATIASQFLLAGADVAQAAAAPVPAPVPPEPPQPPKK